MKESIVLLDDVLMPNEAVETKGLVQKLKIAAHIQE